MKRYTNLSRKNPKEIYEDLIIRKCEIPVDRYNDWLRDLKVDVNEKEMILLPLGGVCVL